MVLRDGQTAWVLISILIIVYYRLLCSGWQTPEKVLGVAGLPSQVSSGFQHHSRGPL